MYNVQCIMHILVNSEKTSVTCMLVLIAKFSRFTFVIFNIDCIYKEFLFILLLQLNERSGFNYVYIQVQFCSKHFHLK